MIHGRATRIGAAIFMSYQNFIQTREKLPIRWTVVILVYLFAEWVYNQHLLQLLEYPSVTAQQFEWTEMFGKAIASIGFNLVLIKCYRKPGIIKFILGVILAYMALSWIFDSIIKSFPDEFRHSSYYGVIHRKAVVEGTDTGQILDFSKEDPWHVRPLVLSQYYLTLQDTQWSEVELGLSKPLEKRVNAALKDKQGLWKKYGQAEEARQYVEAGWQGYKKAMQKYAQYRNDSRYAKRAHETFISRVGAPPDLTFEAFVQTKAKKYHALLNTVLVEGNEDLKVKTIRVRDIPLRMNEKAFYNYLDDTTRVIRTAVAPRAQDIQNNAASKDAVALLVIPPVSIGLSLLSIMVNLVGLVCAWVAVFLPEGWIRRGACAFVCIVSFAGIAIVYSAQPHAIRADSYWTQLDKKFEASHPILWTAMSIPMRLESLLCITSRPVGWIGQGMSILYRPA